MAASVNTLTKYVCSQTRQMRLVDAWNRQKQVSVFQKSAARMPDVEEHACNTTKGTNLPWVEKYRPNGLQELISHEDIISTIRFVQGGNVAYLYNMPQNIFDLSGPSSSRTDCPTCSSMARLGLVNIAVLFPSSSAASKD